MEAFEEAIVKQLGSLFNVSLMNQAGEIKDYMTYLEMNSGNFEPRSKVEEL